MSLNYHARGFQMLPPRQHQRHPARQVQAELVLESLVRLALIGPVETAGYSISSTWAQVARASAGPMGWCSSNSTLVQLSLLT